MSSNNPKRLFYSLLRDALWRTGEEMPSELSEQDTKNLFSIAGKQAVLGLVLDALIRRDVRMPQMWVLKAVGMLEQIKQQGRVINDGVVSLEKLMTDHDISYAIVKGQVVASYYPDALMRQSGDIDYYCDEKNFPLSQAAVKAAWGVDEEPNGGYHVHYDHEGVTYEGHFRLVNLYNKQKDAYWKRLTDSDEGAWADINGSMIRTLSPTLHALYVFLHLYHHLLELGVGLRQFCDWAVMLHACRDEIDHEAVRHHLQVLGLEDAYRACGCILVDYLGLSAAEFTYELTSKDRRYVARILDVVFYRGNMGHYNKRSGFHGWKHKVESALIKLSHFLKFYPLAPSFMRDWGWHVVKQKVVRQNVPPGRAGRDMT